MKKLRVAVLYGGRSGEHEISLRSAASVIRQLDESRFEILPVSLDKQGRWRMEQLDRLRAAGDSLPIHPDSPSVVLPPNPSGHGGAALLDLSSPGNRSVPIDVIFPVMHGPLCEDGTIQGLMELANVAYVGCGVLSSAVAMDKEVAKRLAAAAGIPIVPYVSLKREVWMKNRTQAADRIARELGYPVFVKPANLGSSVGVHKVKAAAELEAALLDAFRYDTKVLVEKSITAREIECSGLEELDPALPPRISVPGEIQPTHEFYSYEAKYLDDEGARLMIPAGLSADQSRRAQEIARKAFLALECEGLSRIDLFLDRDTGQFYFNEINTMPGFTSISMYPKMWEASGLGYRELLTHLVDLAVLRHERKLRLVREFHPGA